jgi:hypothetical protein
VKNFSKNDNELVRQLLATAKVLVASAAVVATATAAAAAEEAAAAAAAEEEDPKMSEKLRQLRALLPKLNSKRNKTLKQMGVQTPIKTTAKVEELVDLLNSMANQ